jgi:hypothetical protein
MKLDFTEEEIELLLDGLTAGIDRCTYQDDERQYNRVIDKIMAAKKARKGIKITITCDTQTYSKLIVGDELQEQIDYFEECQTNGSNPWMKDLTFEQYTRPIECSIGDIDQFNATDSNSHIIFGWFESFCQSENAPIWIGEQGGWIRVEYTGNENG